ncbi:MAG: hypothetical protein WCS52_15600 [bacterium]
MKFMTVREFRGNTGSVRASLEREEEVVLTAGGQPYALVSLVHPESFDRELSAIRRARAQVALDVAQASAKTAGTDRMTMPEIDAVIKDVRRVRVVH